MVNSESPFRPVVHEVSQASPVIASEQSERGNLKNGGSNLKSILLIIILTALGISFVAGGIYVYFSGNGKKPQGSPSNGPTPTPTAQLDAKARGGTPTPSPTPTPVPIDPSEYEISVLNGSGKIGEASKLGDLLEADGYTIASTGNASRFDHKETSIQAKSSVPLKAISAIKTILDSSYEVEVGEKLPSSSEHDLIITVGSQ